MSDHLYRESPAYFAGSSSGNTVESDRFDIDRFNNLQKAQMLVRHQGAMTAIGLFLDLDETCVETVAQHVTLLNRYARLTGVTPDVLPDYATVLHKRGTQHAYNTVFPHLSNDKEFQVFMERIRGTGYVNKNAPILHPNLAEQLALQTADNAHVIGAITARIGTQRVVEVSQNDLFQRVGLPEMPIMFRPPAVSESATGKWKLDNMLDIAASRPDGVTVLLDDSASTFRKIGEYNKQRGENPPIIQILYEGSLTQSFLQEHHDEVEREAWKTNGQYVGNWDNLGAVLQEISDQWLISQN